MNQYEKILKAQLGKKLHYYKQIDSTNTVAKKIEMWQHGDLIVAEAQTAGRGTYGRTFHSKAGQGIYMSIIIDLTQWAFKDDHLATHYTAVVTLEAIKEITGINCSLKWVNDLFVDGKKIGGILTEKIFQSNKLIIGIGLNLSGKQADFPDEIKATAASLELEAPIDEQAAALVIRIFEKMLNPAKLVDAKMLLKHYKEKLFILGQTVEIVQGDDIFSASIIDVDVSGGLLVKRGNETLVLQMGEVKLSL